MFWALVETMHADTTGYVNREVIGGLSTTFSVDINKLQGIIDYCVKIDLLKICEHGNYFNNRVLKQKKIQQNFIDSGRNGANKRWEKYKNQKLHYKNQQLNSPPNAPPIYPPNSINKINNINKRNKIKEKSPPIFSPNSFEMKLATNLWESIKSKGTAAKEPDLQKWAFEFDKIHRIDKRPFDFIAKIMFSARNCEDGFWAKNLLSPEKLRQKLNEGKLDKFIPAENSYKQDAEL